LVCTNAARADRFYAEVPQLRRDGVWLAPWETVRDRAPDLRARAHHARFIFLFSLRVFVTARQALLRDPGHSYRRWKCCNTETKIKM
jgi:hypothetical protein